MFNAFLTYRGGLFICFHSWKTSKQLGQNFAIKFQVLSPGLPVHGFDCYIYKVLVWISLSSPFVFPKLYSHPCAPKLTSGKNSAAPEISPRQPAPCTQFVTQLVDGNRSLLSLSFVISTTLRLNCLSAFSVKKRIEISWPC